MPTDYNGWAAGSHAKTKPTVAIQLTELKKELGTSSSTHFSIPNGGCEHFFLHLKWKNWSDTGVSK
jgi:hypothetical protein